MDQSKHEKVKNFFVSIDRLNVTLFEGEFPNALFQKNHAHNDLKSIPGGYGKRNVAREQREGGSS